MRFTPLQKYQLLASILDSAIDAASQPEKNGSSQDLKALRSSEALAKLEQMATELEDSLHANKSQTDLKKAFKSAYKKIKNELSILLVSLFKGQMTSKKLAQFLKPGEKECKQIKEDKGAEFSFDDLIASVRTKFTKSLETDTSRAETSASPLIKASKARVHTRQRSHTEGNISSSAPLFFKTTATEQSSGNNPAPTTEKKPGPSDLRMAYQKQPRKLSFYHSSSLSSPQSPRSPRMFSKDNLEAYFDNLFACDPEAATRFVIALAKQDDPWGIQVLNAASGKQHLHITDALFAQLKEQELMRVFTELFKLENQQSWCRSNQLMYTLLQKYLASSDFQDYKHSIWQAVFSLQKPMARVRIKQRASMAFKPESYTAEQKDIEALQTAFKTLLTQILAPQKFPSPMKKIIQCAYHDLVMRTDIKHEHDTQIRTIMVFIILRFINPTILEEASRHLTLEKLDALGIINLQQDDESLCAQKLQTLKTWFMNTLIPAIQSLTAPLAVSGNKEPIANTTLTEHQLDDQTLASALFNGITQDESVRASLYGVIQSDLQLPPADSVTPNHNDAQIPKLDPSKALKQLDELLQAEEFSGLKFRQDGIVTTPRGDTKPSVKSIFPGF